MHSIQKLSLIVIIIAIRGSENKMATMLDLFYLLAGTFARFTFNMCIWYWMNLNSVTNSSKYLWSSFNKKLFNLK